MEEEEEVEEGRGRRSSTILRRVSCVEDLRRRSSAILAREGRCWLRRARARVHKITKNRSGKLPLETEAEASADTVDDAAGDDDDEDTEEEVEEEE